MADTRPNPKFRVVAIVLLVLAVLTLLGAFGVGADGTGIRVVFGVLTVVFALLGLGFWRAKQPAVDAVRATPDGLEITVAGAAPDRIPYSAVQNVELRRLSKGITGWLFVFEYVPGAQRSARLRPFEITRGDKPVSVMIGLKGQQPQQLSADFHAIGPETPWRLTGG